MNSINRIEASTAAPPKVGKPRLFKRVTAGIALALVAAGAGAAALTTGVSAASAEGYYLQNVYISPQSAFGFLMLDVSGASQSPGAQIIQYDLHANNANQKWDFLRMYNGTAEIVNVNSGQCITTDGIAGDPVEQQPCIGAENQEWWTNFSPGGWFYTGGEYAIQSYYSGLFLDVYGASPWAGAVIDTWYFNNGDNQLFLGYQG
jgi:hypothetical protein